MSAVDIDVIVADEGRSVDRMTAEERQLFFETMILAVTGDKQDHARGDSAGTVYDLSLASILAFADLFSDPTPLVPTIPELLLRAIVTKGNADGVIIPVVARATHTRSDESHSRVRFDSKIIAARKTTCIIPAGDEANISALMINPWCTTPMTLTADTPTPLWRLSYSDRHIRARLQTGNYHNSIVRRDCKYGASVPTPIIAGKAITVPTVIQLPADEAALTTILRDVYDYVHQLYDNFSHADAVPILVTAGTRGNGPLAFLGTRPPTTPRSAPHEVKLTPELEVFNAISPGIIDARDAMARGFARGYFYATTRGVDSKEVVAEISSHKTQQAYLKFAAERKQRSDNDRMVAAQIINIFEKKFGKPRAAEMRRNLSKPAGQGMGILSFMSAAERKPVELEYATMLKYAEEVASNKCPHVKMMAKLRRSPDTRTTRGVLEELQGYFDRGVKGPVKGQVKGPAKGQGAPVSSTSMINCNRCKLAIICPHVLTAIESELKNASPGDAKAAVARFVDQDRVRGQAFCKICGEVLHSDGEPVNESGFMKDQMDEDIKMNMWNEIMYLLRHIKFNKPIDAADFIVGTRDVCYPYVYAIDKEISKSKTISTDDARSKKRLYIAIYALAYFVHIASSGLISFKNVGKSSGKSAVVDAIKHVIGIIQVAKSSAMKQLGIAGDSIKISIIDAYKMLSQSGQPAIVIRGEAENVVTKLLLDPIFKWYYWADILSAGDARAAHGRRGLVESIDRIMGLSVTQTKDDLYAKTTVPKGWRAACDRIRDPDRRKLMHDAFTHMQRVVHSRVFTEPVYEDVTVKGSNVVTARMLAVHEELNAHGLDTLERTVRNRLLASAAQPQYAKLGKPRTALVKGSFGRIYDEDGKKHEWTQFIVKIDGASTRRRKGGVDTQAMTRKEIAALIADGKSPVIIDKKCAVCGIAQSSADTLDDAKIMSARSALKNVANFNKYYESRCPEGGIHELAGSEMSGGAKGGPICRKCNWGADAKKFYDKYYSVYTEERAAAVETVVAEPAPISHVVDFAELEKFTHNYNIIIELGERLKVNHKLISAMGATEKIDYDSVKSGKHIPAPPETRDDTRLFVIAAHVKNFITEYNQMRFFSRIVKPGYALLDLIDKNFNRMEGDKLVKLLPQIYDRWLEKITWMREHKRPKEALAFTLQLLCEQCIRVLDIVEPTTKKIRTAFVEGFIGRIIRGDELYSKPGYFSWATLYGDDNMLDRATSTEVEDAEFAGEVALKVTLDTGYVNEPFENNFDMDIDPDDDPDDQNQLRVFGEGMD